MIRLQLQSVSGQGLRILCLGAHSDDIEIGCGASILQLLREYPGSSVYWVVFSGGSERAAESVCSAERLLVDAGSREIVTYQFRDGFFPYCGAEIKDAFENIKRVFSPDVIFTHHGADLHQDHRVISELTWNTFRQHLVLEYEIPKYDGGLTTPNVYVRVTDATRSAKIDHLMEVFATQRDKSWFSPSTFDAMMRLRGVECASPTGFAEGFHARKVAVF